jgi:hypothetical protein
VKVDGEWKPRHEAAAGPPLVADRRVRPDRPFSAARHKPIEFEKGKAGVLVASKDRIDALISAARQWELDEQLGQAAEARAAKAKRAA